MKLDKIMEGTYHLIFKDEEEINSSISRMFAPEIETKKLEKWYVEEYLKNKKEYSISGCFLDKEEIDLFYKYNKNILISEEVKLYNFLNNKKFDYLVISSNDSMPGTLEHEVAHVLYYSNYEYRLRVTELIDELPISTKKQMKEYLKTNGYDDDSDLFYDESQACIVGHVSSFKENGVDLSKSKKIIKKLKENFDNHFYK